MSRNRRFKKTTRLAKQKRKQKIRKCNLYNVRCTKKLTEARQYVLNLSKRHLTDTEILLLAKGLKFIPTHIVSQKKILNDFKRFERNMRLKYHFRQEDKYKKNNHPFKGKSKYQAPIIGDNPIEQYLFYTKLELSEYKPDTFHQNITKEERVCINKLKTDNSVCIHKADKNNVTVIQNRDDYIAEGMLQLNDGVHYQIIDTIDIDCTMRNISNLAYKLLQNHQIDDITHKFLISREGITKIPFAYFLPKIHKLDQNILNNLANTANNTLEIKVPGRPIISQCNGPLENIGRFLDYFLLPIVKVQDTYLSDTGDFIRTIESIQIGNNHILVTYDITSLYTNLKFTEIINSVKRALNAHADMIYEIKRPETESLIEILEIILSKNEFTFNKKCFRQIVGVSMGAVASPEICDIAIHEHIENILKSFQYRNKIIFHKRMRDDGFIIFNGTKIEIESLFRLANKSHDLLKFTYELDVNSISFLDTEVYKGERYRQQGILDIKCFSKKTEKYQYLHRKSNHPRNCFKSFIKGEGIRILRNTSSNKEYSERLHLFVEKLHKRGYNKEKVWNILNKIAFEDRQLKLRKRIRNPNAANPNMFVTTYHPKAERLQRILKKFWYIIKRNPDLTHIKSPCVTYKTNKNIGDMLINH